MVQILTFVLGSWLSVSLGVSLLLHSYSFLEQSNQFLKTKPQSSSGTGLFPIGSTDETVHPCHIRPHLRTHNICLWNHAIKTSLSQTMTQPSAILGRKLLTKNIYNPHMCPMGPSQAQYEHDQSTLEVTSTDQCGQEVVQHVLGL